MLDSKIPLLSIREPYATLILQKKKNIELRSWSAKERNTFYIHVPTIADEILCREYNIIPHQPKTIIGKATVTDVKHYNTPDEFANDYPRHNCKEFRIKN
jgi:predicted transcriptional regulator